MKRKLWVVAICVLGGGAAALWLRPSSADGPKEADTIASVASAKTTPPAAVGVVVGRPEVDGRARQTALQCAAHWYESAELHAKVSGYLRSQAVDIGAKVHAGDLLAEIDMPELEQDVRLMEASASQAAAEVAQAAARVKTSEAELRAAQAAEVRAKAEVERWEAERTFRKKEYDRLRQLSDAGSVQASIADEKEYQFRAAEAGRSSAEGAVRAAAEQALAAAAEVDLARANAEVAEAKRQVALAQVERARLMAGYARIEAPFDGTVTRRGFHRGDFILAADRGGDLPLFHVARTDLIRVVAWIPDREVPLAQPGDRVEIEFDALPGRKFTGSLTRIAGAEDPQTRTMRAEVDLPNPDGVIVDQMYGRMSIELEPPASGMTVPSTSLVGDVVDGQARLFVVRDGVARLLPVTVGRDDGAVVEVLGGVSRDDDIVLRAPPGLADGAKVVAVPAK